MTSEHIEAIIRGAIERVGVAPAEVGAISIEEHDSDDTLLVATMTIGDDSRSFIVGKDSETSVVEMAAIGTAVDMLGIGEPVEPDPEPEPLPDYTHPE